MKHLWISMGILGILSLMKRCEMTPKSKNKDYLRKRLFRVTRMSVLEYWKNETLGDGLNLRWGHNVNSWAVLNEHIKDPELNKSLLIEGDVFLKRLSSATPVMAIPSRPNQAITFKDWLQEVATAKKAIKINFRSNDVVKPALQYLFAYQKLFHSPVILHANIMKGPNSLAEEVINAKTFVTESSRLFPDATISVGWTQPVFNDVGENGELRYSWRDIFDILEYTYDLHQPVMYSVRASFTAHSFPQLLWLIGIRDSYSLLLFSEDGEEEMFTDWSGLAALRKFASPSRLLYDLKPLHREMLLETAKSHGNKIYLDRTPWNQHSWKVIQFINPTAVLSTIIPSDRAVAFLGWPTAFLLSEKVPQKSANTHQTISGRILFVPKSNRKNADAYDVEESGLSIFLLSSIDDISSPRITKKYGVQIFIGFGGKVFVENRLKRRRKSAASPVGYLPKAVSQMMKHNCYGFTIRDTDLTVELSVYATRCSGAKGSSSINYVTYAVKLVGM